MLIDIRLEPQKIDLDFMAFMAEKGVPFVMVFTKADKITLNKVNQNISYYHKVMEQYWEEMPYHFVTSAETALGKDELLDYIDDLVKENL